LHLQKLHRQIAHNNKKQINLEKKKRKEKVRKQQKAPHIN